MHHHVQASDEYLKSRVLAMPESAVINTHYNQEGFTRRISQYRNDCTSDVGPVVFLEEHEIIPLDINIESYKSKSTDTDISAVIAQISQFIGQPRNYGESEAEKAEKRRIEKEAKERALQNERDRREQVLNDERNRRIANELQWSQRLLKLQREEAEVLEMESMPLRQYLMETVMSTLTAGLLELNVVRPDDPIDFLAEFLFKHNPHV